MPATRLDSANSIWSPCPSISKASHNHLKCDCPRCVKKPPIYRCVFSNLFYTKVQLDKYAKRVK